MLLKDTPVKQDTQQTVARCQDNSAKQEAINFRNVSQTDTPVSNVPLTDTQRSNVSKQTPSEVICCKQTPSEVMCLD